MKIESDADDGAFVEYDGEPREYTWSANLELEEHAEDVDLVVEQALQAVDQTASGYFVNLVTHGEHGHPESYLYEEIEQEHPDADVEYVDECGCGGHVVRVHP